MSTLVPEDATTEMIDAYESAHHRAYFQPSAYRAMPAAAPVQPVAQSAPQAAVTDGEIPVAPDHCPITGRKFWGNIDHPRAMHRCNLRRSVRYLHDSGVR